MLPSPHINAAATSSYTPIPLQLVAKNQTADWEALQSANASFWKENASDYLRKSGGEFWTWDAASLRVGAVPFETPQLDGHTRPLVMMAGKSVEVPVHTEADRLHFLGNVTVPDGYPTRGDVGAEMGTYTVYYADRSKQETPLRWGLEVTRSNVVSSSTLLNPVALLASPVIQYTRNKSYEDYRTYVLTVPVKHKMIDRVVIVLEPLAADRPLISLPNQTGSGYAAGETALLLFAVTAERF